jgi:hypothetical protein
VSEATSRARAGVALRRCGGRELLRRRVTVGAGVGRCSLSVRASGGCALSVRASGGSSQCEGREVLPVGARIGRWLIAGAGVGRCSLSVRASRGGSPPMRGSERCSLSVRASRGGSPPVRGSGGAPVGARIGRVLTVGARIGRRFTVGARVSRCSLPVRAWGGGSPSVRASRVAHGRSGASGRALGAQALRGPPEPGAGVAVVAGGHFVSDAVVPWPR